ncbi:hypothetical protein B0H10DRAFT_489781 [Mycena sp. CBHHK59/15]|nr:hypothetical protein B0H10DRAFT_489781 [Mycena sp. CBHHK59/15]
MPMHLPPPTPHMNDDISLPPHSDTLSPLQSVQNNRYTRARVFSNPQFPSQRSENTRPMSSTTLSPLHSVQNNGYTRARAFSSPRFSPQRSENTRPMSSPSKIHPSDVHFSKTILRLYLQNQDLLTRNRSPRLTPTRRERESGLDSA